MLKNILNLEGAQQLSKNEQQTIKGGIVETICMEEYNHCVSACTPGICRQTTNDCWVCFPNRQ